MLRVVRPPPPAVARVGEEPPAEPRVAVLVLCSCEVRVYEEEEEEEAAGGRYSTPRSSLLRSMLRTERLSWDVSPVPAVRVCVCMVEGRKLVRIR